MEITCFNEYGEAKMKKFLKINLFLHIFIVLSFVSSLYAKETCTVLKIVDGDTIHVIFKGNKESVRQIGIDTPESKSNKKAKKDAVRNGEDLKKIVSMGKQATEYVKNLVKPGDKVAIEFDIQTKDKYGRLLGYVYLGNGKMLNEEIVLAGYANIMTYPPNVKYRERFLKAYREAQENKKGLWK